MSPGQSEQWEGKAWDHITQKRSMLETRHTFPCGERQPHVNARHVDQKTQARTGPCVLMRGFVGQLTACSGVAELNLLSND